MARGLWVRWCVGGKGDGNGEREREEERGRSLTWMFGWREAL